MLGGPGRADVGADVRAEIRAAADVGVGAGPDVRADDAGDCAAPGPGAASPSV